MKRKIYNSRTAFCVKGGYWYSLAHFKWLWRQDANKFIWWRFILIAIPYLLYYTIFDYIPYKIKRLFIKKIKYKEYDNNDTILFTTIDHKKETVLLTVLTPQKTIARVKRKYTKLN